MNTQTFRKHINLRDLGGYPTKDGRKVKPHLFYRSGALSQCNKEEIQSLHDLHLNTILDLRSLEESLNDPDPEVNGAHALRHSGIQVEGADEIDFSPKGMGRLGKDGEDQLKQLFYYYTQLPFHNHAYQVFFKLIKEDHVPILFHCASGKDRTGCLAMVLLLALGVEDKIIIQDYVLSNQYLEDSLQKGLAFHEHLFKDHPESRELMQMQYGVLEDVGWAVLKSIQDTYGSYDNYFLQEFNLTKEDLISLKDKYTK